MILTHAATPSALWCMVHLKVILVELKQIFNNTEVRNVNNNSRLSFQFYMNFEISRASSSYTIRNQYFWLLSIHWLVGLMCYHSQQFYGRKKGYCRKHSGHFSFIHIVYNSADKGQKFLMTPIVLYYRNIDHVSRHL